MANQKLDDFKRELKELLDKHKAYIFCDIEGDTHGLTTTMMVEIDKKDYILTHNGDIDANDLK